jgi:hypothetical protein
MGGQIEWPALEILAEVYGVEDIEMLIRALLAIRQYKESRPRGS